MYDVFKTENTIFAYYGNSQGDGFSCLNCHSKAVLKPGDNVYLTLLKKDSQGISYNQVLAKANEAQYTFDGIQFKLRAVYATAATNYVKFEEDNANYNFGGYLVVANHSNQPKLVQANEIDYNVQIFYSDNMGTVGK